jgi:acyl transferase domain-containing protein
MTATALVFLFPEQGAYFPGALQAAAQQYAVVEHSLEEIDVVSRAQLAGSVRDALLDPAGPSLEMLLRRDPNLLHMAIYAASVCAYRILEARGCEPSILMGHSLGEIAALVCAGAFTVTQGAEIVAARALALKPAAGSGYMAAIGASPRRCGAIIELLETPQANVAVDNGPSQTIMSGATAAMDRVAGVAQALGIAFSRLAAPYPFHSSQLVPVAKAFRTAITCQARQPLRVPVYSPILERIYEDKDDLAIALSSHLVRPIRFAATVRHVRQTSQSLVFVEIGASNALLKLVKRILSDPNLPAFATLAPSGEGSSLDATLSELRARGLVKSKVDLGLLQSLLPQACTEPELTRFWQARGAQILTKVEEEFVSFRRLDAEIAAASPASDTTVTTDEHSRKNVQTPPSAAAQPQVNRSPLSRAAVQKEIVALYARAMGYPPEVFTEHVALEAQLGIDPAKQMKMLSALEARYRLPPRPESFRLSELGTVSKLTDFVVQALSARAQARAPVADVLPFAQNTAAANGSVPARAFVAEEKRVEVKQNAHPIADRAEKSMTVPAAEPTAVAADAPSPDKPTCRIRPPAPSALPGIGAALPATREALYDEIVATYVEATQYPAAVFREDVVLEAELGIDSVKQLELLSRLEARYRLPGCSDTFLLRDHSTLRKITDFIHQAIMIDGLHIEEHITAVPLPTVAPAFIPSESDCERERLARIASGTARPGANLTRAALQTEIIALFAEAMEYPPEVFSEDVDLEGELGIDSVKQMELLSKLAMRYQLPARPEAFRVSDYGTLRKITDFVHQAIAVALSERTQRMPVYAVG